MAAINLANAPSHLRGLFANLSEVDQLVAMHEVFAGPGPGRKHDVEVLNKSAIVLVVACWEAYVEDLADACLEYMIKNAKDHSVFPNVVLERVGSKYSGNNAWRLAGEGWRSALSDNLKEILARTTGTLNTPKTVQVDELFLKAVGHARLSSCWCWRGRTASQASKALDDLVALRGAIAHRVKHSRSVRKTDVLGAIELISRLSAKCNNEMSGFLKSLVGTQPWAAVSYKGTK